MTEIVLAGGVTGGHLFPGLAVAESLQRLQPSWRITFVGTGRELERRYVLAAGHDYVALPSAPRPARLRDWPRFAATMSRAGWQAGGWMSTRRPALVVGLGGFASVPIAWQAQRRGTPVVLLEQNSWPGRANRWLASRAALVVLPDDDARAAWPRLNAPCESLGNPVRPEFTRLAGSTPVAERRTLLVLGGSGGARSLNQALPAALSRLAVELSGWQIVHQTGLDDHAATVDRYAAVRLSPRVVPFLDPLSDQLVRSGLVISRAGGTTLAELAAVGVPSVLVPFPRAIDDHQRINAARVVAAGGAVAVDEGSDFTQFVDRMANMLAALLADPGRRVALARGITRRARPSAADDIAARIVTLVADRRAAAA